MPKLSVITINFNDAQGLAKTLSSIWERQTFSDFEHIVIDGGSTDGSVEVIKRYSERLAYWVSEPDKGIYNAMNKGVTKANGEYLLFINSGDWLCEGALKNIFEYDFNEDIVSGNYINIRENDKSSISESPKEISLPNLMLHSLGHPATLIRRELLIENPYSEEFKIVSDWAFWVDELILKNRSYRKIDTTISNYNLLGISSIKENIELIKKEAKEHLVKSFGERSGMDVIYDSIQAMDRISKHNISKLTDSETDQRRLRQYYKFLKLLNKK